MPIFRYFLFAGALLLALLFAADRYLPAPVEEADRSDPDRTIIRIASTKSLPEKVVFDTRPQADMPQVAHAEPIPEDPQEQVRQAMATMPATPSAEVKKEPPTRVSAQVRPHLKRAAKPSTRATERRLAFDRHDPFAGGWW
ncbi:MULTISPECIES: hypothetical protein [Bradyrhizobium]|jgi:hypothetical protein|nr:MULTISPECIES: hypothetical protein [Bradyrhizobium]MBR1070317.1 hypothetical protein [Bradyrhizobium liaoningense]MCP1768426.1 hypothetical protein [Bradyrhizobium japonicum]MCP1794587.1 hypothetical protein [Bradyrhizobium japonicum]MCP1811147.1 hypothetical protein [Bradyrhizobium japonicum]MCP1821000.1 hypothetical protein [Bradyrhizobium japonicum]